MNARAQGRLTRRRVGVLAALAVVALALVVVVALLLPRGDGDVGRLKAAPFGGPTVDAAINILARSGVGTYEAPDSAAPIRPVSQPASPLVLLRDQVRAMALEAQAGGGIPGDEIDALIEIDEELAPPSYVLAGYVAAADTPGSRLARELMGEQDWSQAPTLNYPQLVLVLFTADVVRQRIAEASADTGVQAQWLSGPRAVGPALAMAKPAGPPGEVVPAANGGACSSVQNFINNALKRVFDALRLGESGGIGGFFAKVWNFVVTTVESIVTAIVKFVSQKVLNLIAKIAAVVGTVSVIVSAIKPWAVTVRHEPGVTEKGTNSRPPDHGALIARVDSGGMEDWPAWVKDCAEVADQPLPSLKPEGTPVEWEELFQSPLDLASRDGIDAELDEAAEARLDYTTLIDPIDEPYDTHAGMIWTRVTLERQELRELANIAETQLLGALPGIVVQAIYAPLLKPEIDRIIARVSRLLKVSAWGRGIVLFHIARPTPPPPTPPPTPAPTPRPPPPGGGGGGPLGGGEPPEPGCDATCPGSNGDPHMVTVDGYSYDFQAAGEFTLLRSADGRFELQARQEPYRNYGTVSINTAVAVGLDGARAVVYAVGTELRVRINGTEVALDGETAAGELQVRPVSEGVEIQAPDGTLVWVLGLEQWGLNVVVDPSDELEAGGMGVLGPMDGEYLPRLPDGSLVDAETDYRGALYGPFADAWAVTDANTLFDYEIGAGPATYRDPAFPDPNAPLSFGELTPEQQQAGVAVCAAVVNLALREQCAFDVVVTGDETFVETYLTTDELNARRGGDACRLLSDEDVLALTGFAVVSTAPGTSRSGNAGCTWYLESGLDFVDSETGELVTWQLSLDLLAPGGRVAFEDELPVFEALGYEDIADLGDRAMMGWTDVVAVKGDTRVGIEFAAAFVDREDVAKSLEAILRLVIDRL